MAFLLTAYSDMERFFTNRETTIDVQINLAGNQDKSTNDKFFFNGRYKCERVKRKKG
ncbi:hypothetical protein HMPREF0208_02287 [Citrobacter koseri]|uniref:Uncharacterized protein n=1 Tax=Citrobacter koseri (strain ATCC BAA-895 / CDC 4225-83 / SGSC4696) TaxID=290338 RepID=A8AGD7_CITK8|nr:hypothetical protein CKO_01414 [Citrobacter koseri ATCC BAA-895]KWZ97211.1 hypothetical protein HMPREF3220_03263 [Citrobacter koseri]KXA00464.1 hypothetical protein HMPREF3207_03573 [Citrobacter koseri]KXB44099.1 hypothetical protein HMPREF0208_02287 [Citrobacter koseri]